MAVTLVDGKPVAAPGQIKVIAPAQDPIPAVGDAAPKAETDTVASAGGDVESIDTRRPTSDMHDEVLRRRRRARSRSRCCSPRRSCASRASAARWWTRRCSSSRSYGDQIDFIHQEVYTDNDPNKGLRKPLQEFGLQSEPWLFVVGKDGTDHRAARGLLRAERVRAGAQDRAVSTRAAAGARRRAGRRSSALPRPRRRTGSSSATNLPIPEWLFGWAAAIVLVVSFAALAVLWPTPRLQEPAWRPLGGFGRVLGSRAVGVACRADRRRAARRRRARRLPRARTSRSPTSRRRSS